MLSASSSPSPAERQPGLIGDAVRLPAKQAGIASPDVEIASEQKINAAQADAEALCTAKALLKWEKTLRVFMVVAIVLALLLTAVMAAAVYVVADAKETTLHDGVLRSKETEEVIKTASADFEVVDGVLVARGAGKDEHRQVVQTAQNLQRVDHLSSSMPDSLFLSMKELYFRGNNSFVNLRVRGTARLPIPASAQGPGSSNLNATVVKLFTPLGELILDGEDCFVDDAGPLKPLLEAAGVRLQTDRHSGDRRVLIPAAIWAGVQVTAVVIGAAYKAQSIYTQSLVHWCYACCKVSGQVVRLIAGACGADGIYGDPLPEREIHWSSYITFVGSKCDEEGKYDGFSLYACNAIVPPAVIRRDRGQ